jgi:hypothetical protein
MLWQNTHRTGQPLVWIVGNHTKHGISARAQSRLGSEFILDALFQEVSLKGLIRIVIDRTS